MHAPRTAHAKASRGSASERTPDAQAASDAGLRYVEEGAAGIRRRGSHPRFRYVDDQGAAVRDAETIARIRSLAIPPAWSNVWICPSPKGHIQATGRDQRGRKQYRYHARWREHRDADKYARMIEFGAALGPIRAAIERDLALPGLPREKVLATLVRLLELTHARIGNEEYAKSNGSYGLTTLENRHVEVKGSVVTLRFRGKSGKTHVIDAKDPRVAKVVRRCEELPGQHLFEYLDDEGAVHALGSHDVNEYIRTVAGADFSAKDFRTLAGTVLAARMLRAKERSETKAQAKRVLREVLEVVSQRLGNTVAVCRKSYVHPAVLQAFVRAGLPEDDGEEATEERAVLRIVARWELRADLSHLDPLAESAGPREYFDVPNATTHLRTNHDVRAACFDRCGAAHERGPRPRAHARARARRDPAPAAGAGGAAAAPAGARAAAARAVEALPDDAVALSRHLARQPLTMAAKKAPSGKRWSQHVTETSDALDIGPGVFRKRTAHAIATSLKRSADRSRRRKSDSFRSAMSMLTFYVNRAGKTLTSDRKRILQNAKEELRALYRRPGSRPAPRARH